MEIISFPYWFQPAASSPGAAYLARYDDWAQLYSKGTFLKQQGDWRWDRL